MKLEGSLTKAAVVVSTLTLTAEALDVYFRMGASFCALVLGVYGIWKTFFKKTKTETL